MAETTTKSRGIGEIGRARASVRAMQTLRTIRDQARTVADDGERVALSGWSGWGPLAKSFAGEDATWAEMGEQIQQAIPEEDLKIGLLGTPTAFYTPAPIASAMWDMLREFGYDGGPVAELGCGGGVFFGTAPDGVELLGVERDPTAAAICRLLHPSAKVITGALEDTHLPETFAGVIGNVPFADVRVFDLNAPDEVCENVHNYFIWRAVNALAPGGYAILLTSRYTMDALRNAGRVKIGEVADFVGAIRLPNGALGGGTDAGADVVVLRRKGGHKRQTYGQVWRDTRSTPWERFVYANNWWFEEPGSVLGTMTKGKTSAFGLGLVVEPYDPGVELTTRMLDYTRIELVPAARDRNLMWSPPPRPEEFDARAAGVITADGLHEGAMRLTDRGGVLVVKDGRANPLPNPGAELLALLRLRDLAVELVRAEADHSRPDTSIEPIRADTRAAYEAYVKRFGPINRYTQYQSGVDDETGQPRWSRRYPTMRGFRYDPDAPLVFALEMYADQDEGDADEADAAGRAQPAPILTTRQNIPPQQRTHTDDPEQALAWSLDAFGGRVRMDYIAVMLGRTWPESRAERATVREELAALLGDKVYLDPADREYVTAEEYLSGKVRDKHQVAMIAAEHDERFRRNVEALTEALPKWLGPEEIAAQLGTPWIQVAHIEQFIAEVIGFKAAVSRGENGKWEVEQQGVVRASVAASAQWGTKDVDAFTLIEKALNGQVPTVYKRIPHPTDPDRDRRIKDSDKSMLAAEKQQELRARFADWIWEDPDRARNYENYYNHTFNNLRAREFDGSHITIAGMAPGFNPYAHQLGFVARAAATPAALCGHPVGAGKTNTMAMCAIKLKQLGLVNKPMLVVPNHLLEQIDREIRQLFPAARILTGAAKTIASNRLAFTARCATGDWDIVLVTHSAFNAMDVTPETMARYHEEREAEIHEAMAANAGGERKGRNSGIKKLAKSLQRMHTKVKELRHTARPKDKGVVFEQLGVDWFGVDEFHYYKNLALPVETEGFSVRPSKRASDLDMKIRYLRERNRGGPHAALFSGTPISNTMLELYVCLHYTMRPRLKDLGIGSPDAWAANFVQFVTSVEVTVDGGDFQMRTRPALFVNAPELRVLLAESADIRTAEQLGLKRPAADLRVVACEPTETQAWFSSELVDRAEDVRQRVVEPNQDNMLKICTDGRRMATDPALVGLHDDGEHKLHIVVQHIITEWQANPGKLQVAFLDIGTPTKRRGADQVDNQTYGRLRRMLTDAGMDVQRIRFIHQAPDDASKARLFRDCRSGKVDVIIGSTDKLGVGTNIQKLIVAMHHIDAPFRPADVEQRDGRGLRVGNIHDVVRIYRYVTKRTFDAYMWQMLTRKLGFISQMLSGNLDRTVEDVSADSLLSFAAIKAAATDQPLLMEKAEVEAKVKTLLLRERSHRQTVARMKKDGPRLRATAREQAAQAKAWEAIAEHAADVDLGDDAVVEELHARMAGYRYYVRPMTFGGLIIGWRSWRTVAEDAEVQPLLYVDGGAGMIEEQGYKFWKPADVKRRVKRLLSRAAEAAALLRDAEAKAIAEADRCDELAATVFEQAGELATARARLDRIELELWQAASAAEDRPGDGDVVVDADPELDADAFALFAGELAAAVPAGTTVTFFADDPDDEDEDDDEEFDGGVSGVIVDNLAADLAALFN